MRATFKALRCDEVRVDLDPFRDQVGELDELFLSSFGTHVDLCASTRKVSDSQRRKPISYRRTRIK